MPVSKPLARPKDVVYSYDGSPGGFYCCVHESVYARELPLAIFSADKAQGTLWPQKQIATDDVLACKVKSAVQKKNFIPRTGTCGKRPFQLYAAKRNSSAPFFA